MSYNITDWRTKRLENLTIPLEAFFKHEREDFHPERPEVTNPDVCPVSLEFNGEGQVLRGILEAGSLRVTEMDWTSEWSGTLYQEVLLPALEESRGTLEAVLIWEGGDSLSRLTVQDGEVTEEDVEL